MENKEIIDKKKATGLATRFAIEIIRDYKDIIKSVVLFGSTARDENGKYSDIDITIILDDIQDSDPIIKQLEKDAEEIAPKISGRLSIQDAIPLTHFWEAIYNRSPVVFNIIREGEAVYDTGFFKPVKNLLKKGKIKGSVEVVEKLRERSDNSLKRGKSIKTLIVAEDCFQSMIDRSHACLAIMGEDLVSPRNIIEAMENSLVRRKLMKSKDLEFMRELREFRDKCRKKKTYIDGVDVDKWIEKTESNIIVADNIIERIIGMKLDSGINKTQLNMFDVGVGGS